MEPEELLASCASSRRLLGADLSGAVEKALVATANLLKCIDELRAQASSLKGVPDNAAAAMTELRAALQRLPPPAANQSLSPPVGPSGASSLSAGVAFADAGKSRVVRDIARTARKSAVEALLASQEWMQLEILARSAAGPAIVDPLPLRKLQRLSRAINITLFLLALASLPTGFGILLLWPMLAGVGCAWEVFGRRPLSARALDGSLLVRVYESRTKTFAHSARFLLHSYGEGSISREELVHKFSELVRDLLGSEKDLESIAVVRRRIGPEIAANAKSLLRLLFADERDRFRQHALARVEELDRRATKVGLRRAQLREVLARSITATVSAADRCLSEVAALAAHESRMRSDIQVMGQLFEIQAKSRLAAASKLLGDVASVRATFEAIVFGGLATYRASFSVERLAQMGVRLDECAFGLSGACRTNIESVVRGAGDLHSACELLADVSRSYVDVRGEVAQRRDALLDEFVKYCALYLSEMRDRASVADELEIAVSEVAVSWISDTRRCASDAVRRVAADLSRQAESASEGVSSRYASVRSDLESRISALDAGVSAAIEDRRWSISVAAPGSAAFARMAAHSRSPTDFDGIRVLRYGQRDLLRLGSGNIPVDGCAINPPPILLHLAGAGTPSAPPPEIAPIRDERSVVVRAPTAASAEAADALVRQLAIRSLGLRPPGMVRLAVIDPLRSGATFRELGQLQGLSFDRSDLATEPRGVSELLRNLCDEMKAIILASSATGDGSIEESLSNDRQTSVPFRTLCVFGFPRAFDDRAVEDLEQLCRSGDQAGIHVLLSCHEAELLAAKESSPGLLKRNPFEGSTAWITVDDPVRRKAHISIGGGPARGGRDVEIAMDPPFSVSEIGDFLGAFKHDSEVRDTRRFSPADAATAWIGGKSNPIDAFREVALVLGTDASDRSRLAVIPFGRDIAHHALLVGATGSGKTRLLQGIVAAACIQYSPEQVCFWLLDFKSGTGFKPFANARVPHCRVIGLSSDVTYGLDALDRLVAEMNRRQVLFKRHDVENIEQYATLRRAPGSALAPLPRIVAIIDEFQTLFGRDTATAARTRMEQIVKKGRSAGIHLFLCSQSLEGQAADVDSLRSQIKVNIVLQSSASTQRGVLDRDDYAEIARLRRFEGLLDINGNKTIFDVLDLPDTAAQVNPNLQAALGKVSRDHHGLPPALVYDGDSDVPLPLPTEFRAASRRVRASAGIDGIPLLMGVPAAVTDLPAFAELRAGVNGNVVISTVDDRQAETQLAAAVLSVWAAEGVEAVEVDVLQPDRMGRTWRSIVGSLPPEIAVRERDAGQLKDFLQSVASECGGRPGGRRRLLLLREWTLARDFDGSCLDFGDPLDAVAKILASGPSSGIHVLAATSSGRKLEFAVRDYYAVRVASAASQELCSSFGFGSAAVGRMFIEDPSRPGFCNEYIPFTTSEGGIHG